MKSREIFLKQDMDQEMAGGRKGAEKVRKQMKMSCDSPHKDGNRMYCKHGLIQFLKIGVFEDI